MFGTIYANVLAGRLPEALAESPGVSPAAAATPEALHAYPADQIAPIVDAYAHALHIVFLAAVPVPLVALVLALFLKEVPLRGTAREAAADVGGGFGMPEGDDASHQLQLAISRIIRQKGRTELPRVREQSGAAFDASDGWTVAQVHLRSRLGRAATIEEISAPYRVPAAVIKPAFDNAARNGYLHDRGGGELTLTEAGEVEMQKLVVGMRAWLAAELADWGPDDEELSTALGDLATRFVEQAPDLSPTLAASGRPAIEGG